MLSQLSASMYALTLFTQYGPVLYVFSDLGALRRLMRMLLTTPEIHQPSIMFSGTNGYKRKSVDS